MYFDLPPEPPAHEQTQSNQVSSALDALLAGAEALDETAVRPLDLIQLSQQIENDLPSLPGRSQPDNSTETESREAEPAEDSDQGTGQDISTPASEASDRNPDELSAPEPPAPEPSAPEPPAPESAEDTSTNEEFISQLRLTADFQEYDPDTQIITARGNVLLQLNDAVLEADELWLNLINRYALADGDVLLTQGAQLVRGDRAEYNFIQQAGTVRNVVGTLTLPETGNDFRSPLDPRRASVPTAARRAYDPIARPDSDDLEVNSDGSVLLGTEDNLSLAGGNETGSLRQLRFETNSLSFDVEGWRAEDARITNDPFSPPELELRASGLVLRNISPEQDELLLQRPRLVFDQGFSLPLVRRRILLSRGTVDPEDLNPVPVSVGIDGRDRGGFYIGRKVPLIRNSRTRLSVTPQFFVNRAFSDESDSPIDLDNYGFTASLRSQLDDRTVLEGSADVTSLQLSGITENIRTTVGIRRPIGDHEFNAQYSYRERLFNGSLGFQDVQYSLGAVLLSPEYQIGESGPKLTYQVSSQLINAESDRPELINNSGRATLGRFQASVSLEQNFNIWKGEPKPANQNEGLRFTPRPVIPFVDITSGLRTTGTYYTSDDFQNNLVAEVGIEGQLGHLSRNFGDYTRFNAGYSQSFIGGADSPFLFDREVDRNILSFGITQQLYGPILLGFQTAYSLSESRAINTIYSLEYTRRTYGLLLRYDTTQSTGAIGFRLSNFSWLGDSDPFDSPRFRRVEGGVIER